MIKEIIIPTTVEKMAYQVKNICDDYSNGKVNLIVSIANLNFLKDKQQDLFFDSLTTRWVGKKRLRLLKVLLGDVIQIKI